jgi:hypothetical protein
VNGCVSPAGTEAEAGDTATDWSTGAVTVNEAVPLIPLRAAVMVTGPPTVTPVARPAPLIVAVLVFEDDQLTEPVNVWVEPSE